MDWVEQTGVCWPIIRRRSCEVLLYLLEECATQLTTRGHGHVSSYWYPEHTSYRQAVHRLRRQGLLVAKPRRGRGLTETVQVVDTVELHIPVELRPSRYWNRTWQNRWYLLTYDVPESSRAYRRALRKFLYRLRMGQLQRSVYVTPHDIRPEFDDLKKAIHVDFYSMLFPSPAAMAPDPDQIVNRAWNISRLCEAHREHLAFCTALMAAVQRGTLTPEQLVQSARAEFEGYLTCMERDPLLPRELWPAGYLGEDTFQLHRQAQRVCARALNEA